MHTVSTYCWSNIHYIQCCIVGVVTQTVLTIFFTAYWKDQYGIVDNTTGGVFPTKRIAIGSRACIVNSIHITVYTRYCFFNTYWQLCLYALAIVRYIILQTIVYVHIVLVSTLDCYHHVLMREIYVSNVYSYNIISSSLHVTLNYFDNKFHHN